MSTPTLPRPPAADPSAPHAVPPDRGQYGVAALLAAVGAWALVDARSLDVGFGDPVGPRLFPVVIGAGLLLLAVLLAVATARGSRPEPEGGEDVDLTAPADWVTVARLAGVVLAAVATVDLLGWALTGGLLFAGSAWCLGSRTVLRDLLVGLVLSVGSWYAFYVGLGIPLTPGLLDGVL